MAGVIHRVYTALDNHVNIPQSHPHLKVEGEVEGLSTICTRLPVRNVRVLWVSGARHGAVDTFQILEIGKLDGDLAPLAHHCHMDACG